MYFSKNRAKEYINNVIEFIDNGEIKFENDTYKGHPCFYLIHSKYELNNKVNEYLNKNNYDEYDIYFIISKLIKYMLGKYDSHTKVEFRKYNIMPISFKIENEKVYVINHYFDIDNILGASVISVNGIDINQILIELEEITCYSTIERLHNKQERNLSCFEILKSLPSIDSDSNIINFKFLYQNTIKEVSFDINNSFKKINRTIPLNYTYEIVENCVIVHYNSCCNSAKMEELIENLNSIYNINDYVIDLRDNSGGDSSIIKPLLEFLNNKNIVVLVNEGVYSSGMMAFVDLKKIGAYSIGTDISTSLNAFGNCPGEYNIDELGLYVRRSSMYFLYNNNYECLEYSKDNFKDYFESRRELLEPILLHPDEIINLSVNNIINNNDVQLNYALNYLFQKNKGKTTI